MFAWCRSKPIKSVQYLTAQTLHARRQDTTSPARIRVDAEPGAALSWAIDGSPNPDYGAAFKALKKVRNAGERKGAQLGLHMLVGVSPQWVKEAGNLHDPLNPRNRELLEAARMWADEWSGGGCYAARLDLDETGGAVVDLFIAPLAEQRHKSGKAKLVVSVNKALEALSIERTGRKGRHYAALNTSWAEHARTHLDERLNRGRPKSETGAEHVGPDQYRTMMQEAEAVRERARAAEAKADNRVAELEANLAAVDAFVSGLTDGTLKHINGKWQASNVSPFQAAPEMWRRLAPLARTVGAIRKETEEAKAKAVGLLTKVKIWLSRPDLLLGVRAEGEAILREAGQNIPKLSEGNKGGHGITNRIFEKQISISENELEQPSSSPDDDRGPSL